MEGKNRMVIPNGKCCGRCRFCFHDSENEPDCNLFDEFQAEDLMGTTLHAWNNEEKDYVRCPACSAAYPNGGIIEIKAKP